VSNEDLSIIDEINEELKNDRQMEFLKKHKNTILSTVAVFVIGIVIYSSWHERKKTSMRDITNVLLGVIQNSGTKNSAKLTKLLESAPAELRPILLIMRSGERLAVGDFAEQNLKPLLELSQKHGVDLVWKDLALIIYASYPTQAPEELIRLLEPLTKDDRPFRFTALEITGMIYENENKHKEAIECFEKINNNDEAPQTLKKRISILINYIKNNQDEGEKN
jgi:hypothetical protein